MTGPQDSAAAGGDRLRAGHADREQVIEALKAAFVAGRLTKAELDARADQALSARTYADLAALTADLPGAAFNLPAVTLARPSASARPSMARRRPLAWAVGGSSGLLIGAAAAIMIASEFDTGSTPTSHDSPAKYFLLFALLAVFTAVAFLARGVSASMANRRSRRQPPPPGPGGHARRGEAPGGTGHRPAPPGSGRGPGRSPGPGEQRADLRADKSRQRVRHVCARAGQAPGGASAAPCPV